MIVPLLCYLLSTSCINLCSDSDPPSLPPITQSGEDTFGCLVDGEVWLPQKGMMTPNRISLRVTNNTPANDGRWHIEANNWNQTIMLTLCKDSLEKGQTTFGEEIEGDCSYGLFYNMLDSTLQKAYDTGKYDTGKVIITKFDQNILAGTFYFNAVNHVGKKVKITDGRFDFDLTHQDIVSNTND